MGYHRNKMVDLSGVLSVMNFVRVMNFYNYELNLNERSFKIGWFQNRNILPPKNANEQQGASSFIKRLVDTDIGNKLRGSFDAPAINFKRNQDATPRLTIMANSWIFIYDYGFFNTLHTYS